MGAVLAAGRCGVLSHRAGAAALGLLPSTYLEVTVPQPRRPLRGIRFYRSALPPDEITTVRGIPVTTMPRTLLDLAAVLPKNQLGRILNEVERRGLTDSLSLPDLLGRYPRRAGTPAIRALLESGAGLTRSELEDRFLAFLVKFDLPPPELNAWLHIQGHSFECDCLWRRQSLIVELDGRAFHDTATAFERDRARDRRLHAAGWRVARITWRQLRDDAGAVADDLGKMLSPSPRPRSSRRR